ncbi:MAG: ABC transporter ATP-binding protein [Solirubrobacteraceae bacterium]
MSALELRDVVKRYSSGGAVVAALAGVTLELPPGELLAVYGPSGSGKTTLLLLAAGLLAPDAGSVTFDGRDLASLSPRQAALHRRRHVGFVFQTFHLVPGASALENASLKLLGDGWTLKEAARAAQPWLERLGLGERLHQPADTLSMGERQRVAIARALVGRPRLLLADEPTGNLDAQRSRQLLELLRQLTRERELPGLLVTHDPQGSAFADRVLTLRDGKLSDGLRIELGEAVPQ